MLILNKKEALQVCIAFLKQYYDRTQPNETEKIFTALENQSSPTKEQQFILGEWENSLEEISHKIALNIFSTYTEEEIFEAFFLFLDKYYNATKSDDIGSLLGDLQHCSYGATADPAAYHDWQRCLKQIKTNNSKT
jgi:hypothetical protein